MHFARDPAFSRHLSVLWLSLPDSNNKHTLVPRVGLVSCRYDYSNRKEKQAFRGLLGSQEGCNLGSVQNTSQVWLSMRLLETVVNFVQ